MVTKMLLPRAQYLTEQLTVEGQRPLSFDPSIISLLPDELTSLTGSVSSLTPLKEGGPALVLLVEAENGGFVLKAAEGSYRSQELWAEHTAMQLLHNSEVIVPEPLLYKRCGNLTYQLRRWIPGQPLSLPLTDNGIWQTGRLLASIHAAGPDPAQGWQDWIASSLRIAGGNLAAGVFDPDEFTADQPPGAALDWLVANQPSGTGSVCLIHGDFRPKNILWSDGRIAGVVDWQFVDFGDPYYDLSVIHWYMQSEAEWQQFLGGYSLTDFDSERFEYCLVLQKFLNV